MRAAVLRHGSMVVRDDVDDPVPGFGQVLLEVKVCGICGSDLHFAKHGRTMMELASHMEGLPDLGDSSVDLDRDVFMGHEFVGEVLDIGPDTEGPRPGSLVTSVPALITMTGVHNLAYTNDLPAGYSQRMLISAPLALAVPNGLDAGQAALTEPLAVGLHAVNRAGLEPRSHGAIVLGCGPIGLAVIAALRRRHIEPIVASDYSPARRALAATMGAHQTVDPAVATPYDTWAAVSRGKTPVVFDAVGVPGLLDDILRRTPRSSRVVVVGVCMEPDTMNPFFAIAKEINVQYVLAYDPMEFQASLQAIAEGDIDVAPMITGAVDLDGVAGAFAALADPEQHCKILVTPGAD